MRFGVIGFGKMGMLHGGIVNGLEGHRLAAIAEPAEMVSKSIKALNPRISVYPGYHEMLDKEALDGVYITTPVYQHVEMGIACVERGVPIFIEKPLSTTAREARRLVDALDKKPVVNMVAWMMRYLPTFLKGRKILNSGVIGDLVSFHVTMYVSQLFKKGKGWRYDPAKSGGGLIMGPASHSLDLVTWFFGNVRGVNARQSNFYSEQTEDFLHVMFDMESGVYGWLDSSWSVRGRRTVETRFEIEGRDGKLIVTDDTVKLLLDGAKNEYPSGWTVLRIPELYEGVPLDIGGIQYTRENIDFIKSIETKTSPANDVKAGYRVHQVIDAIYRSAKNNGNYEDVNVVA